MPTPIYSPTNYRRNITLYWQQYFPNWSIPIGYHVHHIKPRCTFDDRDDPAINHPKNLIVLHPDDHVAIHKCRGDTIGEKFIGIPGAKLSEETKSKMKLNRVGMTGKNHSALTKQMISNANKGRPKTNEELEKLRLAGLKKVVSEETKRKISKSKKGKPGRKWTEEQKRKMSATRKKLIADGKITY